MTEATPRRPRHLPNLATTSPEYLGSKSFILCITSDTSAILAADGGCTFKVCGLGVGKCGVGRSEVTLAPHGYRALTLR